MDEVLGDVPDELIGDVAQAAAGQLWLNGQRPLVAGASRAWILAPQRRECGGRSERRGPGRGAGGDDAGPWRRAAGESGLSGPLAAATRTLADAFDV